MKIKNPLTSLKKWKPLNNHINGTQTRSCGLYVRSYNRCIAVMWQEMREMGGG